MAGWSDIKDSKYFWWIVGAVVAVIILAALIARLGDRNVPLKAVQSLAASSGYHAAMTLNLALPVQVQDQQQPFTAVEISLEGDVLQAVESPVFAGTLYAEAKGRGNIFFVDGDILFLEDVAVFRLDNLPALLNPSGSLVDKWTYVETSTLQANNPEEIATVLTQVLEGAERAGSADGNDRYTVPVSTEQEQQLLAVLRSDVSGHEGWNIVARLLDVYDVQLLELLVDGRRDELTGVRLVVGDVVDEEMVERAELSLTFSEIGKSVAIERPPKELTVRPEVFAEAFGTGEIVPQ